MSLFSCHVLLVCVRLAKLISFEQMENGLHNPEKKRKLNNGSDSHVCSSLFIFSSR